MINIVKITDYMSEDLISLNLKSKNKEDVLVAIPHAKTDAAEKLTIAFGISNEKIDFKALDNENVNLFFVFASPIKDSQVYLKVLARISRLIREESFRNELLACKTPKEVLECINNKESI